MDNGQSGKKRGSFLHVMLAIYVLGIAAGIWSLYILRLPAAYALGVAFDIALEAVGVYGLYAWKKWGFYFIAASFVVYVVVHLIYTGLTSDILASPIFFGLLWWAYYQKKEFFN